MPSLPVGVDDHLDLQGGDVLGLVHSIADTVHVGADDGFDVRGPDAVLDVVLGEHEGRGDHDGSQLVECDGDVPELVVAFEDRQDHVALPDSQGPEVIGGLVGEPADVTEGERPLVALGVAPYHGTPVGFVGCDLVDHIVSEVVVVWVFERELLQEPVLSVFLVEESHVEVHHLDSPFITEAMNLHPFLDVA